MIKTELTSHQIKYLLCHHVSENESTITHFATYFNCSRTNSKKTLDRMLKIGLFYKKDNAYILTDLGKNLTNQLLEERDKIITVFQAVFEKNNQDSLSIAEEIIASENRSFKQVLLDKYRVIQYLPSQKTDISVSDLKQMLGEGRYRMLYKILKHKTNPKDLVIPTSMANSGFLDDAELIIDKTSYIGLKSKALNKVHQGFVKQGHIAEIEYTDSQGAHSVKSDEGIFYIPLDAVHTWHYLGQGIVCTSVWLNNKAAISFVTHSNKARYLFLLNLYGLK